ncbi:hypothetical protein [Neomesorhizobium albiziae]|nr:hypothetical protein [Mesorhizobium albiziae]
MTMSDALRWAWGDELPKLHEAGASGAPSGYSSGWGSMIAYGELNSIVDRQPNRFGCIPFDQVGWPHADALLIADAVSSLAQCTVDVPEGWHPMPELVEIDEALASRAVGDALIKATVSDNEGAMHFRARPDVLVVRHAILGLVPDWRLSHRPVKEFEVWPNGRHRWFVRRDVRTVVGEDADGSDRIAVQTTEVDGWSTRLQRPAAGAYRKARFAPDPVPVMVARAEYEIFCAAMCMLYDQLDGTLETVELQAVDWPVQPWGDSPERSTDSRRGRILPDLSAVSPSNGLPESVAKSKARRRRKPAAKAA